MLSNADESEKQLVPFVQNIEHKRYRVFRPRNRFINPVVLTFKSRGSQTQQERNNFDPDQIHHSSLSWGNFLIGHAILQKEWQRNNIRLYIKEKTFNGKKKQKTFVIYSRAINFINKLIHTHTY